jgi:hypothetical protein
VVSNGLHFGDFERTGEETVRRNLALGAYTSQHMSLAREWLAKRDRARNDASNAKQIHIARSAKNAAWGSATAAIIAAICAAIAIAIPFWKP